MQITLRFDEELAILVKQRKPKRQALSAFCLDLIEQALTAGLTYAPTVSVRETGSPPSNDLVPCVERQQPSGESVQAAVPLETDLQQEVINYGPKKRKNVVCSDDFNAFWKLYQSCPHKANTQRKTKAWDEWRKAVKIEPPERLTEALENSIAAIRRGQNVDGWAAPLPDCFRWLRDGCYVAALEENATTGSSTGLITFHS